MKIRIGQGIDVHQLIADIPLVIGGVSIPYSKGSKGHSDGDVLYHAIVDAILGALSLGDIGQYFPSDDMRWKNSNSKKFLEHAQYLILEKGFTVVNIDTTIILQEPQISVYVPEMRENIAKILSISIDSVSIKVTTSDYLGFVGSSDGIIATAGLLLTETDEY